MEKLKKGFHQTHKDRAITGIKFIDSDHSNDNPEIFSGFIELPLLTIDGYRLIEKYPLLARMQSHDYVASMPASEQDQLLLESTEDTNEY